MGRVKFFGGGATLALSAVLVIGVGPAAAAWTAPISFSPNGDDATRARVAIDDDGDALGISVRSDGTNERVSERSRSAAGALGPNRFLSPAGMDASAPKVAIDADGDAVVVWLVFDGTNDLVQARTIDAAGVRGPTLTLSAAGQDASFPQVAMNAGGDAAFAWQRSDGTNQRIQGIFRSAAGTLSPVIDLSNAGSNAVVPDVGIDDAGNHFFVWIGFDGSNFRAQLRIRGPGGTISTVADISNAGVNANSVQIAVGAAGDAGFTWLEQVPPTQRVMARVRTAFPVLGSIQQLSRSGISPQVAVDDSGDAVFAWTHFNGESDPAQTRTLPSGGTLSAVQKLANQASQPQVGVDSDGDAVYSWDRFDRVQARTRTWATGALGAIENLSEASVDAARSDVAVNALGGAIVGWGAFDGTFTRAQGAVGP